MNKNIIRFFGWISLYLLLIHLLISCKGPTDETLTVSDVQAIMKEIGTANLNKDIRTVENRLAPFVVINVEIDTPPGVKKIQLTRDEYIAELARVFSQATHYEYQQGNTSIKIRGDGKTAEVETDVIEDIVLNGIEGKTLTHESVVLEIIDGQRVVTVINASVKKKI